MTAQFCLGGMAGSAMICRFALLVSSTLLLSRLIYQYFSSGQIYGVYLVIMDTNLDETWLVLGLSASASEGLCMIGSCVVGLMIVANKPWNDGD